MRDRPRSTQLLTVALVSSVCALAVSKTARITRRRRGEHQEAERVDTRIRLLEERLARDERRRMRNRRIALAAALIAAGLMVGVVPALVLIAGVWPVAGAAVAGAAVILIGIRVLLGASLAAEFYRWITAVAAIAAVVAAIAVPIATVSAGTNQSARRSQLAVRQIGKNRSP